MIIRNFYTGMYDYADGFVKRGHPTESISVQGHLQNTKDKTIKYARLHCEPYNRVGDPIYCEINHHHVAVIEITGPIEPGKSGLFVGHSLWHNPSICSAKVTKIDLVYMDNTTETVQSDDIQQHNLPSASEMDKNPNNWLSVALIWGVLFLLIFLIVKML